MLVVVDTAMAGPVTAGYRACRGLAVSSLLAGRGMGGDEAAHTRAADCLEPATRARGRPVITAPHEEDEHHQPEHERVAADPHDRPAPVQVLHRARRPRRARAGRDAR